MQTHIHTLGLVMAAVESIQHELEVGQKNRELRLLNNRLSSILLTVTDGVLVLDVDGVLDQINPVAERLLGVSNQQVAGKRMTDLVPGSGAHPRAAGVGPGVPGPGAGADLRPRRPPVHRQRQAHPG